MWCACAYPITLLVLSLLQVIAPRRSGALALAQIFAPYLFLPLLAILPLIFLRGAVLLRLLLAACGLVYGVRFTPNLFAPVAPTAPAPVTLEILTWNVRFEQADLEGVRRFIESKPADVIALQEDYLVWHDRDFNVWLEREARLAHRYPHQVRLNRKGLVLLSVYPIIEASKEERGLPASEQPPVAWGRLDLGQGRTAVIATAHPVNAARNRCRSGRWHCFNPDRRDAEILQIRAEVAPFLRHGEPLLLLGDFNTTEREPAYGTLTHGLQDAHKVVGRGMGHTWGPTRLMRRGLPVLRIDYMLSNARMVPLRLAVDCTPRGSDHCALRGRFAVR